MKHFVLTILLVLVTLVGFSQRVNHTYNIDSATTVDLNTKIKNTISYKATAVFSFDKDSSSLLTITSEDDVSLYKVTEFQFRHHIVDTTNGRKIVVAAIKGY